MIRTYSELILFPTFLERFEYLKLPGVVGVATFGSDRYLNQRFYTSKEWRSFRHEIITRDLGCDMAMRGHDIQKNIIIHHINPVRTEHFDDMVEFLMDPENVVCVSDNTHKAIHYSTAELLPKPFVERRPNDTCLWKI